MNREMNECFNDVKNSLNSALAHYQIWFTLRGQGKAIDKYLICMNDTRYVDFFHATNSGNYKLMFIEMACLFDPDSRTHNIRALKDLMLQNGMTDLVDNFEQKLKPFKNDLSTLFRTQIYTAFC